MQGAKCHRLKPSQNKKGRKKFQLHRFLNTFSQRPAVKKYSKNGAAGKFFGPSYFDPALVQNVLQNVTETMSQFGVIEKKMSVWLKITCLYT